MDRASFLGENIAQINMLRRLKYNIKKDLKGTSLTPVERWQKERDLRNIREKLHTLRKTQKSFFKGTTKTAPQETFLVKPSPIVKQRSSLRNEVVLQAEEGGRRHRRTHKVRRHRS